MKLKTIALSAAATAVAASSLMMTDAPASAASLAPGTFTLEGGSTVTDFSGAPDPSFTLNFTGFGLTSSSGALTGLTTTSGFSVGPLGLQRVGGNFNIVSGLTGFIQGLRLGTLDLSLNLDPGQFLTGFILGPTNYSFSNAITGTLVSTDGNVFANVGIGSFRVDLNNSSINNAQVNVETIPTPALLPGLLALGAGVLRKRKSEGTEEVAEA